MALLYEEKVTENKEAFINKVNYVASQLDNIPASWLMVVMNFESKINSKAVNPVSGATGLIQFMPSTAIALGTTTTELYNMSNVQQLDYVLKYYQPYKSKIVSVQDLYLATLFPKALMKPDSYVLQDPPRISADTIARQNPVFDTTGKGYITVGDVRDKIIKSVPNAFVSTIAASADSVQKFVKRNWFGVGVTLTLTAGLIVYLVKNKKNIIS